MTMIMPTVTDNRQIMGTQVHFAEVKWANKKTLVNGLQETREDTLKLF